MNLPQTLVALYIEENSITELPANSFLGLSELEQLFLQRNQIRNISESALSDLTNLKTLDLQANLLQHLPNHVFSNLSNLQTLDISQNLLQLLEPQCFQGLDALKTLQMSRIAYKVEFQEYVFDPLKMLIKLEMYDSSDLVANITKSPRTLHSLRNVQELNIMHNKLTHLPPDFPSFFPKLKVLKVGGNTFHCGPEVGWFSEWIKTSNIQFYSSYSIRCASPFTLHFKPVMLLKEEDFVKITTKSAPMPQVKGAALIKRVPLTNVPESITVSEILTPINISAPSTLTSISTMRARLKSGEPTSIVSSNQTSIFAADSVTALKAAEDLFQTPQTQEALNITAQMTGDQKASNGSLIAHLESNLTSATDRSITDSTGNVTLPTVMTQHTMTTMLNYIWEPPTVETAVPAPTTTRNNHTSLSFNAPQSLLLAPPVAEKQRQETSSEGNSTITSRVITGCSFLLFVALVTTVFLLQARHNCMGCRERYARTQRSSSISYRPQHDEVNILTVSEGTVDGRTSVQRGIRNKLYFAVEGGGPHDVSNEPH
ncbi:leucine-rich repeat-containing protein 4C-like [Rhipicephalus sanguineus]|uniref:leucine-rich repeat-containing protein 4C-like n=1 Tax=Rhipicephalus sanguineus TaxID=34632 RepID=UPI0020C2167B|nr:leucine-rich repeat-containing protein 4C-like [Rhipicephalus sanguineus]